MHVSAEQMTFRSLYGDSPLKFGVRAASIDLIDLKLMFSVPQHEPDNGMN